MSTKANFERKISHRKVLGGSYCERRDYIDHWVHKPSAVQAGALFRRQGCESSLETWLPEGLGMPAKSSTSLVVALPGSEMGFEMGTGGSRRRCLLKRCYLQAAATSSVPIGSPSKGKIMLLFK